MLIPSSVMITCATTIYTDYSLPILRKTTRCFHKHRVGHWGCNSEFAARLYCSIFVYWLAPKLL